jgi:hypothetical protein
MTIIAALGAFHTICPVAHTLRQGRIAAGLQMFLISGRVSEVTFNYQDGDAAYYAIVTVNGELIRVISSSVPIDTSSELVVAVGSPEDDGSFVAIACFIKNENVFADDRDWGLIFIITLFVCIGIFFLSVEFSRGSEIWQPCFALFSLGFGAFWISRYKRFHNAKAAICDSLGKKTTEN